MATPITIQRFLSQAHVGYNLMPHRPAYTARQEAQVTHTPGRDWAKVVTCFVGDEPIQAVLPATSMVNLERLRALAGADSIRLAQEDELHWLYPDCELGAMPPLGPLYQQRVFVDTSLTGAPDIVFNAGTHTDALRMRYGDFAEVAKPVVGSFGERR